MGSNDITKAQKDLDSCKNPTGKLKFIKRSEGVCDQALLHFYFQKTTLSSFFVNLKCHRVTMIERTRKSAPTTTADLVYPLYGWLYTNLCFKRWTNDPDQEPSWTFIAGKIP